MEWHKVEDYPVGSEEYVFVSQVVIGRRENLGCFVAMLKNRYWRDGLDIAAPVQSTDRWCYIDLPKD